MTYSPQIWSNGAPGATPINAARLSHIEDGIVAAHDLAAEASLSAVPTDRIRYVSTEGSNANDGLSEGRPFLTISKAIADLKLQDGGTGYLGGISLGWGTFAEVPTAYAENGGGTAAVQVTGRIPMGLVVQGKGPGTVITNTVSCTDVLRISNASRTTIRDLSINPSGTVTNALHITASGSTENTLCESVWVQATPTVTNSFAVGDDSSVDVSETLFINCVQNSGINGWSVGNGVVGNVGNVRCLGCVSQVNSNSGVRLRGGGLEWLYGTCSNNDGVGDFYIASTSHSWPIIIAGNRSEESFRLLTIEGQSTGIPSITVQDCSVSNFTDPDKHVIHHQSGPSIKIIGLAARHISGSGTLLYNQYAPPMGLDVWTDNTGNPFDGVQPFFLAGSGGLNSSAQQATYLPTIASTPFKAYSSVTGSRISAATAGEGAKAYDTTLHIPIWSDGTNWRNAAGTVV